jgi:hypothetical protein
LSLQDGTDIAGKTDQIEDQYDPCNDPCDGDDPKYGSFIGEQKGFFLVCVHISPDYVFDFRTAHYSQQWKISTPPVCLRISCCLS